MLRVNIRKFCIAEDVLLNSGIYKNFVSVDLYHSENN